MHQESFLWHQFSTKLLINNDEYANFQFSVVIMSSLPLKKYQTYELKSKIIDYRAYSVKICAFYLASATIYVTVYVCFEVPCYFEVLIPVQDIVQNIFEKIGCHSNDVGPRPLQWIS